MIRFCFRKSLVSLISGFKRIKDVKEANNGRELISMVKKEIPDLVILDLEMPVLDGFETAEKLITNFPEAELWFCSCQQRTFGF